MLSAVTLPNRTLLSTLIIKRAWAEAAELILREGRDPTSSPSQSLPDKDWATFCLFAGRDAIANLKDKEALLLLRHAGAAIERCSDDGGLHLALVQVPQPRAKSGSLGFRRKDCLNLLSLSPSLKRAQHQSHRDGEERVPGATAGKLPESMKNSSLRAFHADMMGLYFFRKGKDHTALKWCMQALNLEHAQNLNKRLTLAAHCAVILSRLKRSEDALRLLEYERRPLLLRLTRGDPARLTAHACIDAEDAHTLASAILVSAAIHMRHQKASEALEDALKAAHICHVALMADAPANEDASGASDLLHRGLLGPDVAGRDRGDESRVVGRTDAVDSADELSSEASTAPDDDERSLIEQQTRCQVEAPHEQALLEQTPKPVAPRPLEAAREESEGGGGRCSPGMAALERGFELWKEEEREGERELRRGEEEQRLLRRLDVRIGHMLRESRALAASQLRVIKGRVVTWSAKPLDLRIAKTEQLLAANAFDADFNLASFARPVRRPATVAARTYCVGGASGLPQAAAPTQDLPPRASTAMGLCGGERGRSAPLPLHRALVSAATVSTGHEERSR